MLRAWVRSLVGELRFRMLHIVAKNQSIRSGVFLEVAVSFCSFSRNSLPNTLVCRVCISVILHIKMLLLETAVIWYTAEMLRVHFTFCYIEYEKDSTERLGI